MHGVSTRLFGLLLSSFKLYECARKDNHSVNQKWLNITDKTDYLILALQEIKKGTKINRIFFEISLIWVQILRVLFKLYNFSYELLLNNIFCSFFCFKETEFSKIKAWVFFFLTSSLCLVKTCSSNVDKRIMNVFSWSFVSILWPLGFWLNENAFIMFDRLPFWPLEATENFNASLSRN